MDVQNTGPAARKRGARRGGGDGFRRTARRCILVLALAAPWGGVGLAPWVPGPADFPLAPRPVAAQEADGPATAADPAQDVWRLTLEEAIAVARRNNPTYRQAGARISAADWAVREAYGGLAPSVSTSAGLQYVGAGNQRIGIFTGSELGGTSTDYYLSDYSLSLSYTLSGASLYGLARSRADRSAAEARYDAAAFDLDARVTAAYLTALRARDAAEVARRQLERSEESLELATARFEAGAVPGTDLRRAEVERGREAVALVRAENGERAASLALLEQMGVESLRPLRLASELEVFEPDLEVEALVTGALDAHPLLSATMQAVRARRAGVREAQTSYLPTVSASVSWSGFARELGNTDFLLGRARSSVEGQRESCALWNQVSSGLAEPLEGYPRDCGQYRLTATEESRLLRNNDVFPFGVDRQPISAGVRISFPLFEGFSRQRRVEEAEVAARAAEEDRRAEELRLRTRVVTAHGNLGTAYQVLQIEERNRELAAEQLDLAQQRYGLGAAPFLELLEAQTSVATAERDYLNAVYDFHGAWAELERATGLELDGGTPNGTPAGTPGGPE